MVNPMKVDVVYRIAGNFCGYKILQIVPNLVKTKFSRFLFSRAQFTREKRKILYLAKISRYTVCWVAVFMDEKLNVVEVLQTSSLSRSCS